ncbi:MAG: sigma-B regulation protein RsbU (phosphoserine phosphatase) [Rhodospirillaceae bacterium]|nr:MAG: sigma-B regulation protein RsbU (phosphoserine phosphatase) [Rhodospirillaceae bacterium]
MTKIHENSTPPLFNLRVPARADRLKLIRSIVCDAALLCGCSDACAQDLMLAVDEACQNIIRHAYQGEDKGDIVVEMFHVADHIDVFLCDSAPTVNPATIHPRDLDDIRPGGLGTHIINSVMEGVTFQPLPSGAGNLLRMSKRITYTFKP